MLGVFEKSTAKQPVELLCPSVKRPQRIRTKQDIAQYYSKQRSDRDATFYNFMNGNLMATSLQIHGEPPPPSGVVLLDEFFCIFHGILENACDLRRIYRVSETANEALIVCEAYKILRNCEPFPPDHFVRELKGSYSFILFDSKNSVVFLARDRLGGIEFHWGTAGDGSLVCCDDGRIVSDICGGCYTPFPQGCFFLGGYGLVTFNHPYHMVRGIEQKNDLGQIKAIIFQVDLHSTRLYIFSGTENNQAMASLSSHTKDDDNNDDKLTKFL